MRDSKSIISFFTLTTVVAAPFWVLGYINKTMLFPGVPISALWIIGPLVAALVLSFKEGGLGGMIELFKRTFDFKRIKERKWYLPIILLMPAIAAATFCIVRLSGSPVPLPGASLLSTLSMFVIFFVAALSEELGWMGYVIDPMQSRWGALNASLLLGLLWGVFHILPILQSGQTYDFVFWQFIGIMITRIIFVWIYNNTGKSVFGIIVLHALLNVSWQVFFAAGPYYDPLINAVIVGLIALLVVYLWGNKTLAQYRLLRD